MNCENCGAATHLDRNRSVFICDYCGSEMIPPAGADGVQVLGETKLNCPACNGMLSDAALEFQPLLYCATCHGMLIGMDVFGGIIQALRSYQSTSPATAAPRNAATGKLPRICARCSKSMENHPYGGPGNVVIDTCEPCELNWLDKQELQRIVAAPDYSYGAKMF